MSSRNRGGCGNCLTLILAILLLIWLTCWGGCQLIQKKTAEGLEDKPVPTAPVTPATPVEKK
jgi:hypothetical protein